jgi:putative tryptophan/tyrosine transport system substrate-binding protein
MQRREFITLIGGTAAAWPLAAHAQQAALPVIGFLNSTSPDPTLRRVASFRQGLNDVGYVERQNVAIEYRWAENQPYMLPRLVAGLVRRQVAVIATTGGTVSALAAKRATSTIPIVFEFGGDPITAGLVDNLSRPGGNITGMSLNVDALVPKQLDLLRELIPKASVVALLVNPDNPITGAQARLEAAARAVRMQVLILKVTNDIGFDAPFMTLLQQHADALLISNDPYLISWREKIVALAARYKVPTIYTLRDFATAGGLVSYGSSITDEYRQVGVYVGRILKGEKPADLPVVVSNKFELVINLTAARALALDVPTTLLARADEVIE